MTRPPAPATPRPDVYGNVIIYCTRCGERSQHFALNPMPDICAYCYAAGTLAFLAAAPAAAEGES